MASIYPEWIYDIDPQQEEYLKCTGRQWFYQMRFRVNHPELSAKPSHGQIKDRVTFVSGQKSPSRVNPIRPVGLMTPHGALNHIIRSHKTPALLLLWVDQSLFWGKQSHSSVCSTDSLNPRVLLRLTGLLRSQRLKEEVTCGQVWWHILRMCALYLPHPSAHTPGAAGSQCCGVREQLGVRCPQGSHLSRGIEGGESAGYSPCRTWDSNPRPLGYKSDSLTIRPWLL